MRKSITAFIVSSALALSSTAGIAQTVGEDDDDDPSAPVGSFPGSGEIDPAVLGAIVGGALLAGILAGGGGSGGGGSSTSTTGTSTGGTN